jgi:hypothetical protein
MADTSEIARKAAVQALADDLLKISLNHPGVDARIKPLSFATKSKHNRTSLQFFHATMVDNQPSVDDLVGILDNKLLRFCIPSEKTRSLADEFDHGKISHEQYVDRIADLQSKARRLFISSQKASKRSGESGELLLYLLSEWVLGAPQILAKMSLKTNPGMPVHGADGIHISVDLMSDRLMFYFGESKVYKSVKSAVSDAVSSIESFVSRSGAQYEIELLTTHIALSGLGTEAQKVLLDILDPYTESMLDRRNVITGLIVFDSEAYKVAPDSGDFVSNFNEVLEAEIEAAVERFDNDVASRSLEAHHIVLFLFPIDSVATLRQKFHQRIGWQDV